MSFLSGLKHRLLNALAHTVYLRQLAECAAAQASVPPAPEVHVPHVPLELPPEIPGWQDLVREVQEAGGGYVQLVDLGNGVTAPLAPAPLEWCLLVVQDGRIRPCAAVCCITGESILASAPRHEDGTADWSHFGVRCARCARPIHIKVSGMMQPIDAPSCPACRGAVKAISFS